MKPKETLVIAGVVTQFSFPIQKKTIRFSHATTA